MVGVKQMRGFGGCNDLIISGHVSFWTMTPLMYAAYYRPRPPFVGHLVYGILWFCNIQSALRVVYESHHYSVDVFFAWVVTYLCWHYTERVYPASPVTQVEVHRRDYARGLPRSVGTVIVAAVGIAAFIVILGAA